MYSKIKSIFLMIVSITCCIVLINLAKSQEYYNWMYILAGIAGICAIVEFVAIFKNKDSDNYY